MEEFGAGDDGLRLEIYPTSDSAVLVALREVLAGSEQKFARKRTGQLSRNSVIGEAAEKAHDRSLRRAGKTANEGGNLVFSFPLL